MVVRWLLPIVAMLALLGNAASSFAAAGIYRVTSCCCPDPTTCQCGDHGAQKPNEAMNRCGGAAVKVIPHQVASVAVEPIEPVVTIVATPIALPAIPVLVDRTLSPPEPPPF